MASPKEIDFRSLMKSGHDKLQVHDLFGSFIAFVRASNRSGNFAESAEAMQMIAVCMRQWGNLSEAESFLTKARTYAAAAKNGELEGKILRDLAFVTHDRYMILKWLARRNVMRRTRYNEQLDKLFRRAVDFYLESQDLLRHTASLADAAISKAGEGLLYYERHWSERKLGRGLVRDAYTELVRLGHPVYETNALIRLLRTLPFLGRLRYTRRIIEQTSSSSASSGARSKAVIVLLGGNIGWHIAAMIRRS